MIDALLVIGAPNSSNSQRLVEVGRAKGCAYAQLVQRADTSTGARWTGVRAVGITAGASAPEVLITEVIDAFHARYDVTVELVETAKERVSSRCRGFCAGRWIKVERKFWKNGASPASMSVNPITIRFVANPAPTSCGWSGFFTTA